MCGLALSAASEESAASLVPPVDPDAMREAMSSNLAAPPVGSAEAYWYYLRGNLLAERGNHSEAIDAYREALALDESANHIRVKLASEYWRAGLTDQAETEARQAIRSVPRSAEAHELLGNFYLQQDRSLLAAKEFERALAFSPERAEAYRGLVQARFGLADERGIERALDAWAKHAPGEPFGWREYGRLLLDHGDLGRAEKFLLRALSYRPEDPQALAALGRLSDERGANDRAMALYERSLRADSEDMSVLFALGQHHLLKARAAKDPENELARARACFNSLVAVAADEAVEARARSEVAKVYLQADFVADALRQLDAAIDADPENSQLRFERGTLAFRLRRFDIAADDLASIQITDDNYAESRVKLGLSLLMTGKGDAALAAVRAGLAEHPDGDALPLGEGKDTGGEAIAFLERAVEDRDFRPEFVEALADAYESAGKLPHAIALLQKSLRRRPDAARLRFLLGAKLKRSGDFDGAVSAMREVLRTEPRNAEALNFIGYEYAERGIRLSEAEKLVAQALAIAPENGQIADSMGWVYFKEGKVAQALDALLAARRFAPDEPLIAEHLGDVYQTDGHADLAIENYRLALKILDANPDPQLEDSVRRKLETLKARTASSDEHG
jgi:tetratricopeptide (TPR) repeat protein